METKRQSDDFAGDSNASWNCGGHSSWRFDEGQRDIILNAIFLLLLLFFIEQIRCLINEWGFYSEKGWRGMSDVECVKSMNGSEWIVDKRYHRTAYHF